MGAGLGFLGNECGPFTGNLFEGFLNDALVGLATARAALSCAAFSAWDIGVALLILGGLCIDGMVISAGVRIST